MRHSSSLYKSEGKEVVRDNFLQPLISEYGNLSSISLQPVSTATTYAGSSPAFMEILLGSALYNLEIFEPIPDHIKPPKDLIFCDLSLLQLTFTHSSSVILIFSVPLRNLRSISAFLSPPRSRFQLPMILRNSPSVDLGNTSSISVLLQNLETRRSVPLRKLRSISAFMLPRSLRFVGFNA